VNRGGLVRRSDVCTASCVACSARLDKAVRAPGDLADIDLAIDAIREAAALATGRHGDESAYLAGLSGRLLSGSTGTGMSRT